MARFALAARSSLHVAIYDSRLTHPLVGHLTRSGRRTAAVMRALLATRRLMIMAVHDRILCGSENRLCDLVADAEGPRWRAAQDKALGVTRVAHAAGCHAAL